MDYEYFSHVEEELKDKLAHAQDWMGPVLDELSGDGRLDDLALFNALEEVCSALDIEMPDHLTVKRDEMAVLFKKADPVIKTRSAKNYSLLTEKRITH